MKCFVINVHLVGIEPGGIQVRLWLEPHPAGQGASPGKTASLAHISALPTAKARMEEVVDSWRPWPPAPAPSLHALWAMEKNVVQPIQYQ